VLLILGAAMAVKSLAIAHRDPPAPVPALAPALGFSRVAANDTGAGRTPGLAIAFGGPGDTVSAPVVYNGREGQLAVKVPRLGRAKAPAPVLVDHDGRWPAT
jgi:hypothetical protein